MESTSHSRRSSSKAGIAEYGRAVPGKAGWRRAAQDAREALDAEQGALTRPSRERVLEPRPTRQAPSPRALTLVAAFGSVLAALVGWGVFVTGGSALDFSCSVAPEDRFSGANIGHAVRLVLGIAVAGFLLAVVARRRPRLLLLDQLLMSAALLAGIVLVALDSAASRVVRSCFLTSAEPATAHFYPLYVVWGAAIVVLLWQARRTERDGHVRARPE